MGQGRFLKKTELEDEFKISWVFITEEWDVVCITRDANITPPRLQALNTDSHMTGDHQHSSSTFGDVSIDNTGVRSTSTDRSEIWSRHF